MLVLGAIHRSKWLCRPLVLKMSLSFGQNSFQGQANPFLNFASLDIKQLPNFIKVTAKIQHSMNRLLCFSLKLILCVKGAAGSVEVLDRKNQGINPMA